MSDNFALLADAWLDGSLDQDQAARLLTWLETSPGATAHLRALAGIDHGLRALAAGAPDGAATRRAVLARLRGSGGSQRLRQAVELQLRSSARPRRWSQRLRRRGPWSSLAAALVLVLVVALALGRLRPEPAPLIPGALAVVEAAHGWVTSERDEQVTSVESGLGLAAGDWLVTGENAGATLRLADGTRLELLAGTRLRLPAPDGARAQLDRGTVRASVAPQAPDAAPILSAPGAVLRVLGTEFTLDASSRATRLRVSGGVVALRTGDGRDALVRAGEELRLVDGRVERTTALSMRRRPGDPWHAGQARTLAGLPELRGAGAAREPTTWGSAPQHRTAASGRFALRHQDGRWWAVDPEGRLAVLAGVSNVRHVLGRDDPALLARSGSYAAWLAEACEVLAAGGCSLVGSGSDTRDLALELRRRGESRALVLSYEVSRDFAKAWQQRRPGGERDLLAALAPLLPGFGDHLATWQRQLSGEVTAAVAGIVTDRPIRLPDWAGLRRAAQAEPALAALLVPWLAARARTLASADAGDLAALHVRCLEAYRDQVLASARRAAPHTPLIGQLLGLAPASEDSARILGGAVDVVGLSLIGHWLEDPDELRRASARYARPLFIESLYAKGADSGLPNRDGNGLEVPTQADRARYYQHLALLMLESRVVIGWQWYRYEDAGEGPYRSLADYDSNKGLIDPLGRRHQVLLDGMRELNVRRYALIDYLDRR